jgi:GDPmannose 4,6-dehydratase
MTKKALITGVTGQDGSYLAESLLEKGYEVHGIKRRTSSFNTSRIDHIFFDEHEMANNFYLHHGDLMDTSSLVRIVSDVKPDEIYNLAAQSHVAVSFDEPEYTANSDALGCLRILEALRNQKLLSTKFYQASTSELYGNSQALMQDETTPFQPRSPYAAAKLYAFWMTVNYREAFGLHASNGILFNHESPRRGETFVTRKITRGLAQIKFGLKETLYLGNLNSKRDWGHARDYVDAMWRMMQLNEPIDLVIATGIQHTVREFVELACTYSGFNLEWRGEGLDEVGFDKETNKIIIKIDSKYYRPTEVDSLHGDFSLARSKLNWNPSISFEQLVQEMADHDLALARKSKL